MYERHSDKPKYFNEQAYTTEKYVIPFISSVINITNSTKVLEIGCAEGGNMKPFLNIGCSVTGIDIAENRIELAKQFFKDHPQNKNLTLVAEDIYKAEGLIRSDYNLIIMRDVIEHIPNQEKFMSFLKRFLADDGVIFFAFPPWQNPFGGHQQVCESKFLSRLPFFHLLPMFLYKLLLKAFGESNEKIEGMEDIKKTGISLDRFEKIIKKEKYNIKKVIYYFINPNYEIKFKLKPRHQISFLTKIPYFRNYIITAGYYLISKK